MDKKYRAYLLSDAWKKKKQAVFERARKTAGTDNLHGVCEKCGYKPYKPCLQVHHKTYAHIYNEPLEDLELLCPRCHRAETIKQKAQGNT